MAPCAAGPRGGARLCGGLESSLPTPVPACMSVGICARARVCVCLCFDVPFSEVLPCLCTHVSLHLGFLCVPTTVLAPSL